jgi:hypothetical protein
LTAWPTAVKVCALFQKSFSGGASEIAPRSLKGWIFMTRITCSLALCSILLSLAGCSGSGGASGGAATPEAAFDKFTGSMQKKDYPTAMAALTPESQDMMLGMMAIATSFMSAFDPAGGKDAKAILDKHGIKSFDANMAEPKDPKDAMKQLTAGVKDKPAAISELMVFMEKSAKDKGGQTGPTPGAELADAKLVDVKVEGASATGSIKMKKDGVDQTQPAKFQKIGEAWFVDLAGIMDAGDKAPPMPAGPPAGLPGGFTPPGGK